MSRLALAYCIDSKYPMPLAVSLRSALECWNPGRGLDVFILESGVLESDKARVEASLPRLPRTRLHWLPVRAEQVDGLRAGLHFSSANFFRLLLPELLPRQEQLIYLDADTLVLSDLSRLAELFDDRCELQASRDYTGTISNPLIRLPNHAEFGLAADAPYFNSGVLLMNLRAWRENRVSERVMELGRKHPETTFLADQTPINIVLHGRIGTLPPEWNAQTVHPSVLNGTWNVPYLPQDLAHAKILHYTTEFKPWDLGRDLPQAALFREVRSRTSWEPINRT